MTLSKRIAKPAILCILAATVLGLSGPAHAETGWLWFDAVFASPKTVAKPAAPATLAPATATPASITSAPAATPKAGPAPANERPAVQQRPLDKQLIKQAKTVRPVVAPSPVRPTIYSATLSEPKPNCFWCSRPVFIAGLSF